MSKLPVLTAEQRQAAVDRAGDSLALTSGAGCGKTLVLARRFTTLLLAAGGEGESPFDRFVALTFTEKAAQEMAARVRAVLLDRLAASANPAERQRLAEWVAELPGAHISTIHSFCASVLRRHAVEAGIDPDFAVCADDLLSQQMIAEAATEAVLSAVEAADGGAADLLARGRVEGVIADAATLVSRRIAWADEDFSDPAATVARWRDLQAAGRAKAVKRIADEPGVRDELDYLSDYRCGDPEDKLAIYRAEKLGVIERLLDDPAAATAEDVAALGEPPGNRGGAKAWGGKDDRTAYRQRLKAFVERFTPLSAWFEPPGPADADAAECLSVLTGLARSADARYAAAKRRAGLLDFEDLIILTRRLLRDRPAVRAALRRDLSQLLIDECQDTDPHQLEMLWGLLTDADRPPAAGVFVVGDVKQSIYRFRGARAEAFRRLCARFGRARISLTESFRVHKAGAAFVNHVFGRLMDGYEPIVSSRAEMPPGPSVEILLGPMPPDAREAGATAVQAEIVAERIERMIGAERIVFDRQADAWREARPGDVAVLFTRMTKSLAYERALQRRDIPYYVVAGTGFFRQQEVYDCLNVLSVIDNPYDDVALFGVLRSSLFGLDDNALFRIASAGGPPHFDRLAAAAEALPATPGRQLRFAADLLGRLHRAKDALGPAGVLQRVLDETAYEAVLLSQFNGRRKLGNVRQVLAAARGAQASGELTLAEFVRRFSERVMDQSRTEQAPAAGPGDDVVQLMTVHKAKGLEFPVVIIPDLNAAFRGPKDRLLFSHDWSLTTAPPATADEPEGDGADDSDRGTASAAAPVSCRLARQAEAAELAEEDIRKLYVAATRHQDHLIFVGADWRREEGGFRPQGSFLATLDGALGIAAAIDAGAETLTCGDGCEVRVERVTPRRPRQRGRRLPVGQRLADVAADGSALAAGLAGRKGARPAALRRVGLLTDVPGGAALAPTALADFLHCPALYRWRHELRCPPPPAEPGGPAAPAGRLDAATTGTVLHRCMEIIDLSAADLPAQADAAVAAVCGEMELDADRAPLAADLAGMLKRFARSSLCGPIRAARRRLAELAFVLRAGRCEIGGRIDLLFEDAGGDWHVVDYKSDRVSAAGAEAHARRYELQMMIYLAAARRQFGQRVADATVWFLRPAVACRFRPEGLDGLAARLDAVASALVAARRTGRFDPGDAADCRVCSYAALCRRV